MVIKESLQPFSRSEAPEKTALSDSAAFDKLRPRASRGELVAGRQSLQKDFRDSFKGAEKG